MNADIPFLRCWVRLPFISDRTGVEEAYAFAIQSHPGRALAFHVMLQSGAHYRGVPIHAIALRPGAIGRALQDCQMWDCFSSRPVVTVFQYLKDHAAIACTAAGRMDATYLFTVDWLPDSPERPGFLACPEQTKCAHVLAMSDGNLAALPTNRVLWKDGYFVGSAPLAPERGYTVQDATYSAEASGLDVSQDSNYLYGLTVGTGGPAGDL